MTRPPKALIVAGVMSGTSADGVDVALVRIAPTASIVPKLKLLHHAEYPYPKAVREAVLRAASGDMQVAELGRLHWRLGEIYAQCIERTCASAALSKAAPQLIGIHGQTIYHQGKPEPYLGQPVRVTCQIGEAAVLAERLRVPVVSDFRSADMAAGGQGAPLVPMLDYCLFRSPTRHRVLLNLGGIANMTAIPANAELTGVIAFDSGPANMVIDALMQQHFGKPFDRGGKQGARGNVCSQVVERLMRHPYFAAPAPKSCGREQFGTHFAQQLHQACGRAAADSLATATALTVRSIYDAYARICWPHLAAKATLARGTDLIAAGGGTRNAFLMAQLQLAFTPLGVKVTTTDAAGLPSQAKEATAFALLAWLTWHGLPGNVPSATGASRPVVLGKVSYG